MRIDAERGDGNVSYYFVVYDACDDAMMVVMAVEVGGGGCDGDVNCVSCDVTDAGGAWIEIYPNRRRHHHQDQSNRRLSHLHHGGGQYRRRHHHGGGDEYRVHHDGDHDNH